MYIKMKVTRRQLKQLIKEETRRLSENEGKTINEIYYEADPLAQKLQQVLQSSNDPNLTTLGRIIAETVAAHTLAAVHGKDNAALKARLVILKKYIDSTSKG